jgi:hypothetical protein
LFDKVATPTETPSQKVEEVEEEEEKKVEEEEYMRILRLWSEIIEGSSQTNRPCLPPLPSTNDFHKSERENFP